MPLDQTRTLLTSSSAAPGPEARLYLREEELDRAVDLVLAGARAFFRVAEGPLAAHALGPAHYRALAAIRRHGAMPITALIARLGVRKQSLARVLSELERAGLIAREPSPSDRRSRLVTLTPAGKTAEHDASAALRERLGQVFRAVGAESVVGARRVLEALAQDEETPG